MMGQDVAQLVIQLATGKRSAKLMNHADTSVCQKAYRSVSLLISCY